MTLSDIPFSLKILIVFDGPEQNTPENYAIKRLQTDLKMQNVQIISAANKNDGASLIAADPTIQAILFYLPNTSIESTKETLSFLNTVRKRNADIPIFLMSSHLVASEISSDILDKVSDFIWILEDTADFIVGRILAAVDRYRRFLLPPMFKALVEFSKIHEYSWHTPGHAGGIAFLKSPAGRTFFNFFKEPIFRSDLSISVEELGSLLDHSGPIGESERYAADVFGAHRTYFVTNGSSTSNRIILTASVTHGQIALCDRNCHKSVEHAITMSGAIPSYLMPSRNRYGIIGPIFPENLTVDAVKKNIADNPLSKNAVDSSPRHAIITNSTYDGLCYNITRVSELLGQSTDRLHFDEAWYGYARFNPIYKNRFAMCGELKKDSQNCPSIFATQSTHKLLAAFSQASMIHVRYGRNPIHFERFNEAFMMHSSTSPFYPIIASNDITSAMMSGTGGRSLTDDSIKEAVSFRRTVARLNAEYTSKKDWFFNIWQPEIVHDPTTQESVLFYEAPSELLCSDPDCWTLKPNEEWHGFGAIEANYCMLDPIKVSLITPGLNNDGTFNLNGIPANIVTAYLDNKGIIVEKTTDFTILLLFSLGITKGKWGTLLNALFEFKQDYADNTPLERVIPKLVHDYPYIYAHMGLKDLCNNIFSKMAELKTTEILSKAFSKLPTPDVAPAKAYEELVLNHVEPVFLKDIENRTVATGVVPYPPGIPLLMPGENIGNMNSPILNYLKALETFDRSFPGFTHDIHGVKNVKGNYQILCLK